MRAALPNLLTAARGLAGPAVAVLVLGAGADFLAFWVFLAAILTDLVDGWLARRLGAVSALGKLLDPLADKLLIATTWLTLGLVGWAPWWLAGLMLTRDVAVGIGWLALGRPAWPASMVGRLKVSFEGVALPVLLFRHDWLDVHWPTVGLVIGLIALVLSVSSALSYLRLARRALRSGLLDTDGVGAPP